MKMVSGILVSLRPRQWVKNLLVVIAPAAAGELTNRTVMANTAIAFGLFCLGASGLYLINDVRDREADRHHPTKSQRPIAAGIVPAPVAWTLGVTFLAASALLSNMALHHNHSFGIVLCIYLALTLIYSSGAKRVPVIEFFIVASGFFLRALAGATASHLFVSNWFLTVTAFSALFLVVGKRAAEVMALGDGARAHRSVLADYTPHFLRSALTLSATVVVTSYCLWAFDISATGLSNVHHQVTAVRLTVIPVVVAILHILQRLERGDGGAPEDLVFSDRTLQVLGLIWAALFLVGVHAG